MTASRGWGAFSMKLVFAIIMFLASPLLVPFSQALAQAPAPADPARSISVLTAVDACSDEMSLYRSKAGNLAGAAHRLFQTSPPQWRWASALVTPDGMAFFGSPAEAAMPTTTVRGACGYKTLMRRPEVKKKTATVIFLSAGPRDGKRVSALSFSGFLEAQPELFAYPVWSAYGSGRVRLLWIFFLGRAEPVVVDHAVSVFRDLGFTPVFPLPLCANDPKSLWREMAARVPKAFPVRPLAPVFRRSGSFSVQVSFMAPETLVFDEDSLSLTLGRTAVSPPMPGWRFGQPELKGLSLKHGRVTADIRLPYTAPSYLALLRDRSLKHSEAVFSGGFRLKSSATPGTVGPADDEGLLNVFLAKTFSQSALLSFSLPLTLGIDYRIWPLEVAALIFWAFLVLAAWREFRKSPPDGMTLYELKRLGRWFIALGILGGLAVVLFIGGHSP